MILNNNNLSPIPFYGSLAEQDFRKWYAYGGMYKNIVDDEVLIPFFFVHPNTEATISWIKFFKCCGEEISGAGSFNMSLTMRGTVTPSALSSKPR